MLETTPDFLDFLSYLGVTETQESFGYGLARKKLRQLIMREIPVRAINFATIFRNVPEEQEIKECQVVWMW